MGKKEEKEKRDKIRKEEKEKREKEKITKPSDSLTSKSKEHTDENIKSHKKENDEETSSVDGKMDKISKKKQIVPALKPKAKDLTAKSKKSEKNPIDSTARKIMPTKPMPAISQSKLKKDENNKKDKKDKEKEEQDKMD